MKASELSHLTDEEFEVFIHHLLSVIIETALSFLHFQAVTGKAASRALQKSLRQRDAMAIGSLLEEYRAWTLPAVEEKTLFNFV